MTDINLITTYLFRGQEFLVKMNVVKNFLEINVTDKQTGEEWQCSYDHAYIESVTHKTGNFKQFDIFTTMLKSGLLKTSECISLDLLTYEDLENLRIRKYKTHSSNYINQEKNKRRFLIVIYNVEFDRILYPLPLEYCGPPDPAVLQSVVKKLEAELEKTKSELQSHRSGSKNVHVLQKRIDDLELENSTLREEIRRTRTTSKQKARNQIQTLQSALDALEKSVVSERKSHFHLVEQMKRDKMQLMQELSSLRNILCTCNSPPKLKRFSARTNGPRKNRCVHTLNSPVIGRQAEASSSPRQSPKLTKSNASSNVRNIQVLHMARERLPRFRRQTSRQSSSSSCKYSDQDNTAARSIRSKHLPTTRSSTASSRSGSLTSNKSTASRNKKTTSSKALKLKLKSSEEEFQVLENRISTLQKMLQEHVNIRF